MLHLVKQFWTTLTGKRNRPLLWTFVACLVIGTFEISSPLDDVMRVARNKVRAHDASGQIVVVTIDGPTVAAHGEWPWPRNKVADLVDKMNTAGASRIAFEHIFVPTGSPELDKDLAAAFSRLPRKPFIGASFDKDPVTHQRRLLRPGQIFANVATTVGNPLYFNGFGHAWRAPYRIDLGEGSYPSLAAALGVTVSIDDYGTGYCTLEYLKTIKATELKIDRGFVAAMDQSRSDRVLVNATIELAHSLGHSVVAEGVETLETLNLLKSMGCDKAQGFFISRPMPRDEFFQFVDRQVRPEAA